MHYVPGLLDIPEKLHLLLLPTEYRPQDAKDNTGSHGNPERDRQHLFKGCHLCVGHLGHCDDDYDHSDRKYDEDQTGIRFIVR